ncbi:hypothetical protein ABPG72_011587 [Tetrahymena utriculariae]
MSSPNIIHTPFLCYVLYKEDINSSFINASQQCTLKQCFNEEIQAWSFSVVNALHVKDSCAVSSSLHKIQELFSVINTQLFPAVKMSQALFDAINRLIDYFTSNQNDLGMFYSILANCCFKASECIEQYDLGQLIIT